MRAGELVDGVLTGIVAVNVVSDLVETIPKFPNESMEVHGNIGEALEDVMDFDF